MTKIINLAEARRSREKAWHELSEPEEMFDYIRERIAHPLAGFVPVLGRRGGFALVSRSWMDDLPPDVRAEMIVLSLP